MYKYWSVCLLWCVLLASVSHSQVLETPVNNTTTCNGVVTLYEGSEETKVTNTTDVNLTVDKVKLEGCGCFTLHSKKMERRGGKSFFMGRAGEYTAEDIGWSKVKSVRIADCERLALPLWGVIIIVVGLVVVVGVLAVLGFKKYRQYSVVQN